MKTSYELSEEDIKAAIVAYVAQNHGNNGERPLKIKVDLNIAQRYGQMDKSEGHTVSARATII